MTIYIDVLFCVNFIIDYVMLLSVIRLMSLSVRKRRLLLGALAGGGSALTVLLPPLPLLAAAGLSLAEALLMIVCVLAPAPWRQLIRASLTLFAISFLYCGIMTAILALLSPCHLTVRNNVVYIDIPPLLLIILTIICYGLFRLYYSLKGVRSAMPPVCQVLIREGGRTYRIKGMIDTGHWLHEPFSGDCVIICRKELFGNVPAAENLLKGTSSAGGKTFRLIPFLTVGGSGLLPAFRPSEISIVIKNKEIKVSAYLALSSETHFGEGCDCIVPDELIRKGC